MKARLVRLEGNYILISGDGIDRILTESEVKSFTFDYQKQTSDLPCNVDIEEYEGQTILYVNGENNLVIVDKDFLCQFFSDSIPYLSVSEYAAKHGKKTGIVSRLCSEKRIAGARKKGRDWQIPAFAPYPDDARRGRRVVPVQGE